MSLRAVFLLLLADLALLVYALWYVADVWAQRLDTARRIRLARGRPARRPLRVAADTRLRRTRVGRNIEARLFAAGIGIGPSDALLALSASVVVAYLAGSALFGRVLAVVAAAGAAYACHRYIAYRQAQRQEAFVAQLPELAWTMSNASAAGLALPRAIELAATELDQPAADVLKRVVEELRVGQPVDRALENLRDRVPSREVGVLVSTLSIQQRTGGDTVAALREMSRTLDARKDLRREVRTTMAGSITTTWAVGGLALGVFLLLNLTNPGVFEEMTRSGLGRAALFLGMALFVLAFWLIRRITRIET